MWHGLVRRLHLQRRDSPTSTFGVTELRDALRSVGLDHGQTVVAHTGWKGLRQFSGSPADVVRTLLDIIGPEGTLVMPAFPSERDEASGIFDVRKTPTAGGLVAETFRRWPGVRRSININHSVCALGPQADFLTRDHHRCVTVWDEYSPYYRLRHVDGMHLEIGLDYPLGGATIMHCADSILREENPVFEKAFTEWVTYKYRDAEGRVGQHTYLRRQGWVDPRLILEHYDRSLFRTTRLHDTLINLVPVSYIIDRTVELGRQGLTCYVEHAKARARPSTLTARDPQTSTAKAG